MQSRILKSFSTVAAVAAISFLSSVFVCAQRKPNPDEVKPVPITNSCPQPVSITLNATTPNVFNGDFNGTQLGGPRAWLNDPAPNKSFLYTFQWQRDERCCEITRAVLTIKMKSNQAGQSKTSADAGNDGIAIMYLTHSVPPFSEAVYTSPAPPFAVGAASVKTWTLTGAALSNLNLTRRLSIYVQDDTMVQSASLQLWGCCLSSPRPTESVGYVK